MVIHGDGPLLQPNGHGDGLEHRPRLIGGGSIFWSGGKEYFTGPYGVQSVASSSFGQTFAVTPLQMISAFAAVINGGHLLQPYLVRV